MPTHFTLYHLFISSDVSNGNSYDDGDLGSLQVGTPAPLVIYHLFIISDVSNGNPYDDSNLGPLQVWTPARFVARHPLIGMMPSVVIPVMKVM